MEIGDVRVQALDLAPNKTTQNSAYPTKKIALHCCDRRRLNFRLLAPISLAIYGAICLPFSLCMFVLDIIGQGEKGCWWGALLNISASAIATSTFDREPNRAELLSSMVLSTLGCMASIAGFILDMFTWASINFLYILCGRGTDASKGCKSLDVLYRIVTATVILDAICVGLVFSLSTKTMFLFFYPTPLKVPHASEQVQVVEKGQQRSIQISQQIQGKEDIWKHET